jgi:glycosyltransferase involved in cell wall biosynthesis
MNENTDIYIWGAGYYGVLTALDLEDNGIEINGFIDKNAKVIKTKLGLPVLEPDEIKNKKSKIIIAIQNEYAIKEIMETLLLYGLKFYISSLIQKPTEYLNEIELDTFKSTDYLEEIYAKGENNGAGSYNSLTEFKAKVLNDFVKAHSIQSVTEFGCRDENQLLTNAFNNEKAELTLSLNVISYLVEDNIFEDYMKRLFESSQKYVIIYASNKVVTQLTQHIKRRKFTDWIEKNKPNWKLLQFIPNKHSFLYNDSTIFFSDFYIFGKESVIHELININFKISVIISVYNTEKYLRKCLDSVINQTYKNIEIICVNDASTDNSLAILNEYTRKDSRIVVLDKKINEGLPQARKTAFINSSGEYVIPIDGDDYIELNMLENLYYCVIFGNYDMVCCGYYEEKDRSTCTYMPQILPEDKIECIKHGIFNFGNAKVVWNKLVKRNIYEKVKFGKENNGEDCFITCQNLYYSQRIGYFPEPLYHWRYTGESLTTGIEQTQTRYEDIKINYGYIIDFCKEKFGNDLNIFEPELSRRMADIERRNSEILKTKEY